MVRFLADASLSKHIVSACRRLEPTMDFLSSADAGLAGVPDPEVLAIAAREGRILVTHDIRTMPYHCGNFLASECKSPGVLLISQKLPIATAAAEIVMIWAASEGSEWENRS